VRDYLHVMDLAQGHVQALAYAADHAGFVAVNLGTGQGTSVLELVRAFERVSQRRIPLRKAPRRAGDIERMWADPALAASLLGWRSTRGVEAMCADGWRWQQGNPHGYEGEPPAP
jgi:UDP-glucose 4-epimerase